MTISTRMKDESRGQALVMTIVFLTVMLGMTALVLDVGSWYRAKRELQAAADAAALAGAQALPESAGDAKALALQYADKNGGGLSDSDVSFSSAYSADDTISVTLHKPADTFFAKLFGLDSVSVSAKASARAANAAEALYVAPIVVNWQHPMLKCKPLPCPDPTSITLSDLHNPGSGDAAGSFGLIDLDPKDNGSVGSQTLGDWITHGFDHYMPLGDYYSVPSSKFNSSWVRDAMTVSVGTELLFPVYKSIVGPGDNAQYLIIGWVGFYVDSFDAGGSNATVYGHFTRRISEGIQAKSGDNVPDYGVRVVQLTD